MLVSGHLQQISSPDIKEYAKQYQINFNRLSVENDEFGVYKLLLHPFVLKKHFFILSHIFIYQQHVYQKRQKEFKQVNLLSMTVCVEVNL